MTSVDTPAPAAVPFTESSGRWRALLLAAVAACAACGIIYELALLTLSASLNGGGIVATSLIVAGYIAALGAGALLVKPLLAHAAITFIAVEALLGIVGGLSAAALYVVFAFIGRLDVGAGGEHGPDRRPGRRRGATADDAAAARPHRRCRRHRPHAGQPQRRRLPRRAAGRAGVAVRPAAAPGDDPRRGGHRHHQPGGRGRRVDLPAAARRFHPAAGDGAVRARRRARRCSPRCWCARPTSRRRAGNGFTPIRSSPTGTRPIRRSW